MPLSRSTSKVSLAELAQVCRLGRVSDVSLPSAMSTGFFELDDALPLGGWPLGAVTEIFQHHDGVGELGLVMPALAKLSRERYVAFIAPPYLPYPPALAQRNVRLERVLYIDQARSMTLATSLWAAEQMLRCSAFGAVLHWSAPTKNSIHDKELRRLQLAAEKGGALAILYRPLSALTASSPAALRICLSSQRTSDEVGQAERSILRIDIKKCRGGHPGRSVQCSLPRALSFVS